MSSPLKISGISSAATASGIKKKSKKLDLAIISLGADSQTAAVFTQNVFCAAPIIIAKNHLQNQPKALLINSGNANAGTGKKGLEATFKTCQLAATELKIKPDEVLPFSTGVIGQPLPIKCFEDNTTDLVKNLAEDNLAKVSEAILTTDLVTKVTSKKIKLGDKTVSISAIAKGSGMICPNMATMLCFIFTDICATQKSLQSCLKVASEQSFNRITIDGDTSTNDAATLTATGKSGVNLADFQDDFQKALNEITLDLAHKIIADGEGATKFVEIKVSGSSSENCLKVAYTVAHSPLVKTALFASDANWGRILAAVGRSNVAGLKQSDISIKIGTAEVIKNGEISTTYTEKLGSQQMQNPKIQIQIQIGKTPTSEKIWTTDLSPKYLKINAEYRT